MYAQGFKNVTDHMLRETHTLDAILVITTKELGAVVNEIIQLVGDDPAHTDMIKNSISSVIMDTVNQHIPCNAYSGMLTSVMIDEYRINPDINMHDAGVLNSKLLYMVNHIHTKMRAVGKDTKYVLLHSLDNVSGLDKVYAPYAIDLSNFRTIEFRFYSFKHLGGIL